MNIRTIIGNPPYQENVNSSGNNTSLSRRLFPSFILAGDELTRRYAMLITPSRWFAGKAQDGSFTSLREYVKNNQHHRSLTHFGNASELFTDVTIKGGVSYMLSDSKYVGDTLITVASGDDRHRERRRLFDRDCDILVTDSMALKVLKPVPFAQASCSWQEYLSTNRLEITCGEAPFLVSRYDSITGEYIEIRNRIGQLDRKLRVVNENTSAPEDWMRWAEVAFKTIYGYEWQGDNIVVARLNFIQTFIEYYRQRFGYDPNVELQLKFAYIISWNVWQMDGLKFVIPETCGTRVEHEGLFGDPVVKPCKGCQMSFLKGINEHNGVYACVMDWEEDKVIEFRSIYNEEVARKNKIRNNGKR